MTSENEKMEHEYNHALELDLQEQFNKSLIDKIADIDFSTIPNELLAKGHTIVQSDKRIADGQSYRIMPDKRAFLTRIENGKFTKERELTREEYKIAFML